MQKKSIILPLLIAHVVLLSILIISNSQNNPHTREGECERCHIGVPSEENTGEKMVFVKDIDALCNDCHQHARETSHPTGQKPSFELPEDFHLDWMGRVTCATCHDIHQEKKNYSIPFLLRRPISGRNFCYSCHPEVFSGKKTLDHKLTIGIAHLEQKYYVSDNKAPIDTLSMQCLSCHDGTISSLANYEVVGQGQWQHGRSIGVSHPIGIDYKLAASKNRELRPPEELNPVILLFDGKVGCCSCHNTFIDHPNYLVMENRRSVLCLECHLK